VVEPVADVDVNVPGVMAMLAAPVVFQVSVLLAPYAMVVGLATNEPILGLITVTATLPVTVPTELVAVSV